MHRAPPPLDGRRPLAHHTPAPVSAGNPNRPPLHVTPPTRAQVELLVLPYAAANGGSAMHRLIDELASGRWTECRAAVAFVRASGNNPVLLDALRAFASRPETVLEMTFGADLFGGASPASDLQAVQELLAALDGLPGVRIHLYHEPGRTFHPKLYLFADPQAGRALVMVGSSNWSEGGLVGNVEANVVLALDFDEPGNREMYQQLLATFSTYWSENA